MKRRKSYKYIYVLLIIFIGVGFAYLTTNLNINGVGSFGSQSWDIHFENVVVDSTSYSPDTPIVSSDDLTITFSSGLKLPGDYYKFDVDIVNDGSLDAMLDSINVTANGDFSDYISYSIYYPSAANVRDLSQYDRLPANTTYTLTVEFSYMDIDLENLPTEEIELSFTLEFNYVMANENAHSALVPYSFANDDWETVIAYVGSGKTGNYHVGDTKTIELGNGLGTHTLRIANKSYVEDCDKNSFSQTACGFVLEFADIISLKTMNDLETNVGGWPATDMRTYLNDTNDSTSIINSLPEELRNAIIDTKVISGHGSTGGESNFTSTDKIYLFSSVEIYGTSGVDSLPNSNTRQLDYYSGLSVSTSSYSDSIKQLSATGNDTYWWLRSADSTNTNKFCGVGSDGSNSSLISFASRGVSPAFRLFLAIVE